MDTQDHAQDRRIDAYIACWNEGDAAHRATLAAEAFAEGATYVDPMMQGEGREGIAAMIGAAQGHFPGHRFARRGTVDSHHGLLRFCWSLAPASGEPAAEGTDIVRLAPDGRFAEVIGFLDSVRQG